MGNKLQANKLFLMAQLHSIDINGSNNFLKFLGYPYNPLYVDFGGNSLSTQSRYKLTSRQPLCMQNLVEYNRQLTRLSKGTD